MADVSSGNIYIASDSNVASYARTLPPESSVIRSFSAIAGSAYSANAEVVRIISKSNVTIKISRNIHIKDFEISTSSALSVSGGRNYFPISRMYTNSFVDVIAYAPKSDVNIPSWLRYSIMVNIRRTFYIDRSRDSYA